MITSSMSFVFKRFIVANILVSFMDNSGVLSKLFNNRIHKFSVNV